MTYTINIVGSIPAGHHTFTKEEQEKLQLSTAIKGVSDLDGVLSATFTGTYVGTVDLVAALSDEKAGGNKNPVSVPDQTKREDPTAAEEKEKETDENAPLVEDIDETDIDEEDADLIEDEAEIDAEADGDEDKDNT